MCSLHFVLYFTPGQSGGPIITDNGRLAGIHVANTRRAWATHVSLDIIDWFRQIDVNIIIVFIPFCVFE